MSSFQVNCSKGVVITKEQKFTRRIEKHKDIKKKKRTVSMVLEKYFPTRRKLLSELKVLLIIQLNLSNYR